MAGSTPKPAAGKTFGVAVLGTGRIGGSYIDVVKQTKGAAVIAVAEPREEQVAPLKMKNPGVEFVADYKHALARKDVDIVVGTLPHWLHKQAAIDSVRAGKHVFLEKPMAVTLADCDEMLAAAKKAGVKLMTAHTQRYYPAVAKAKQVIDSGELGSLVMTYDYWHKPYQPYGRPKWMLDRKLGGGMGLMDGTHQIDRTLWVMGDDPVRTVSAQVGAVTHPELPCDDTAMCFLRFKSGRSATLARMAWDRGATEYGADYFLTKGMVRMRIAYGSGPTQKSGVWLGDTEKGDWREVAVPTNNSLLDEFQAFVDALARGDADTPIPQMHGRNVMEVLEATEKSSETGREVVLGK